MTTTWGPAAPRSTDRPGVLGVIAALGDGIAAARALELNVTRAEAVAADATDRLGIAPDSYVVALVGGTGVGKSTILNALAGEVVSAAGARRPTTGQPVAWAAAESLDEVRPLLARLGIDEARGHAREELRTVVIVDLPDVDSLEAGHRAIVESLLPKLDVVAWVVDPEKYADAVLHDDFLRDWLPRLDRQVVLLNKVDRLDDDARGRVTADIRRFVRQIVPTDIPVIEVAAGEGEAGIAGLRRWLADAAAAKSVVAARVRAAATSALAELAAAAGVAGDVGDTGAGAGAAGAGGAPLIAEAAQRKAIDAAVDEVLRVVDLPGAERQAVAATRARARRRGTGPMGLLTSAIYRVSGRARSSADPAGFLRSWRNRGGLVRATEVVRRTIADSMPGVPPALRARYAAAGEASDLEVRLGSALDRVVVKHAELEIPTSRLWPAIGLLQTANTILLVFAVVWVILWIIARPEVATYDLPALGPVAAPMVLLFVALAAGYVLARLLGLHAGWLGRRWARKLSGAVRAAVRDVVAADAFAPIARIEAARVALALAARQARLAGPDPTRS